MSMWSELSTSGTLMSPPTKRESVAASEKTVPAVPSKTGEPHMSADELMGVWGRVGVQICEVATTLFEHSKKSLVGDGTYHGFVDAVVSRVPNAVMPSPPVYGYMIYAQSGATVQKRASDIMPGDIVLLCDAKFKGHKGLQTYNQTVGVGEPVVGVVSEFELKKSKIRVFEANQHVGQQVGAGFLWSVLVKLTAVL
jgi:myosin tail region-interacting protein MTI1